MLWNKQPAVMFAFAKADLPREFLIAGMRKHLGYEIPDAQNDLFPLGVTPEDDELLDRVGLFGKGGK